MSKSKEEWNEEGRKEGGKKEENEKGRKEGRMERRKEGSISFMFNDDFKLYVICIKKKKMEP